MNRRFLLNALREQFSSPTFTSFSNGKSFDAFILPSTDDHQSEYLSEYDFRVKFLSGFSGSNAFVIVTLKEALLFTDGRYFEQAEKELAEGWTLMKSGLPDSLTPTEWLMKNLSSNSVVCFDPHLSTYFEAEKMIKCLGALNIRALAVQPNLVDGFWECRPERPQKEILTLPVEVTGRSIDEKLADIRSHLLDVKCTSIVLCSLDDVMWTLNIRGFDIPYNPLVFSYLLVSLDAVYLFIDLEKVTNQIKRHLQGVELMSYDEVLPFLKEWNEKLMTENPLHRVLIPASSSYAIGAIFSNNILNDVSPVQVLKAVKNNVEMEGMRQSHIRDSATLVEFFAWLEKEVLAGNEYSEVEVAAKIDGLRSQQDRFVDLSFPTISASGEHAALPHYHTNGEEGNKKIIANQVYLCDSGAHYVDGTTDVTRTVMIGETTKFEKNFVFHNTLVLKGHITLAKTKFPEGIIGSRLDSFTRHSLWQSGLDFGHGTGHGVGHFLNVHEGPIGIGHRVVLPGGQLKSGQVLTIEPGYYLPGSYGIRIENCYEIIKAQVPSEASNFLAFKSLTLVPIQTSIVDKQMLSSEEVQWLNDYHDEVLAHVGDYLRKREKHEAYQWLCQNCKHI
ncbi:unnamed protein product [Auanema sp. JU1783]|nr:unnamed protein product [Auanema sp. JU1783]